MTNEEVITELNLIMERHFDELQIGDRFTGLDKSIIKSCMQLAFLRGVEHARDIIKGTKNNK